MHHLAVELAAALLGGRAYSAVPTPIEKDYSPQRNEVPWLREMLHGGCSIKLEVEVGGLPEKPRKSILVVARWNNVVC